MYQVSILSNDEYNDDWDWVLFHLQDLSLLIDRTVLCWHPPVSDSSWWRCDLQSLINPYQHSDINMMLGHTSSHVSSELSTRCLPADMSLLFSPIWGIKGITYQVVWRRVVLAPSCQITRQSRVNMWNWAWGAGQDLAHQHRVMREGVFKLRTDGA